MHLHATFCMPTMQTTLLVCAIRMQGRGTRVQPMYACFTLVVLLTCSSVAAVPITCAAHETHGGDVPASSISHAAADGPILVVGSINVDTIIHLDRLPMRSETRMALQPSPTLAVGGKGETQMSGTRMYVEVE